MKSIYLLISRNRKTWIVSQLNRIVRFLYFAIENKNNDHSTNGEFWLMKQLSKLDVKVIFDVGANVGKWSTEARRNLPGLVYAFEPMPEVFAKLQGTISGKAGIQIYNIALSNRKGSLTFNYYPNGTLFSSIYSHPMGGESRVIEVPCMDGDGFCEQHNIDEIDFLKVDAEGSEHLIFEGFKVMLQAKKIRIIQFEYGVLSIDSKFLLKDYFDLFSHHGYVLGKIYPNHISFQPYDWTLENFIGPNYVAVKNNDVELINLLK